MKHSVFVPAKGAHVAAIILPRSGIVGTPIADHVKVDYEGNKYGAASVVTFADRVRRAADRQREDYPTIARTHISVKEVIDVGVFDDDTGEIVLHSEAAARLLADWLNVDEIPEHELRVSESPIHAR